MKEKKFKFLILIEFLRIFKLNKMVFAHNTFKSLILFDLGRCLFIYTYLNIFMSHSKQHEKKIKFMTFTKSYRV